MLAATNSSCVLPTQQRVFECLQAAWLHHRNCAIRQCVQHLAELAGEPHRRPNIHVSRVARWRLPGIVPLFLPSPATQQPPSSRKSACEPVPCFPLSSPPNRQHNPCRITGIQPATPDCCPPGQPPSSCVGSVITLNASVAMTPVTEPGQYPDTPAFQGSQPPVQVSVFFVVMSYAVWRQQAWLCAGRSCPCWVWVLGAERVCWAVVWVSAMKLGATVNTHAHTHTPSLHRGCDSAHPKLPPSPALGCVQAEVLMLDRTILITGSDISPRYKPAPPPPWPNPNVTSGEWPDPWSPWANSSHPTEGLHVLAVGRCDNGSANGADCVSFGGYMKARYVRVEKAGQVRDMDVVCVCFCVCLSLVAAETWHTQTSNMSIYGCTHACPCPCLQRGFIGRYPLHFHKMGDCPACEFVGNAVVGSTQRGIVIHSTHRSQVVRNVVFGARGAHLYVEEGTEVDNLIQVCGMGCQVGHRLARWARV